METAADSNWFGLFTIVLLVAVLCAVLYVNVRKPDRKDAAAFADLAQRRGWRVQRHMATLGKGYRVKVTPGTGEEWSCLVTRYLNIPTTVLTTEFRTETVALEAGMVVIGPGLPEADAVMAEKMMGGAAGLIGRLLSVDTADGDVNDHLPDLHRVTAARLPGASLFATDAADFTALLRAFGPHLQRWQAVHQDEKAFPILIASPKGLRLRLRLDADAPQLEGFIDMARAFAKDMAA
jgi:hypothetical protein